MNVLLRAYPGDQWVMLLASVIVQVTVVTAAAWLLARLGGRWNAAWRHTVWLLALACVLIGPALSCVLQATGTTLIAVPTVRPAAPAEAPRLSHLPDRELGAANASIASRVAEDGAHVEADDQGHGRQPDNQTTPHIALADVLRAVGGGVLVVWALGVALLAVRLGRGLQLTAALRREARPLATPAMAEALRQVRQALGTDRLPQVAASSGIDRPILVGLVRPLVILPEDVVHTLRESELADVLVHECAHAVCRHQVVGMLQRAAGVLFWPHPLVHLMNRELARAREEVCDNFVLRCDNARRYAQMLLDLSQSLVGLAPRPMALGLFHSRWKLEDRIADLLDRRRTTMIRINRLTATGLTAAFLLVTLLIAGTSIVQAAPIERRSVNKMVEDIPVKPDLSTPESALAALCRAEARQDVDALKQLTWTKLDLRANAGSRLPEATAKKALDIRVANVLTYRNDLAAVIVRMNASLVGRPIVTWHFGRIDGQWKYLDVWNDLHLSYELTSIEAAEQRFADEKDMLWRYFMQIRDDVKQRHVPATDSDDSGAASTAPSRSAKWEEEIASWKAKTWRIGFQLNTPDTGPQAVQYTILDHDPAPGYLAEVKRMQEFYRQQLEKADTEAWREQHRRAQMQVSWNAGFQDVSGDRLWLLVRHPDGGSRSYSNVMSSNGPAGKKWVVTKAASAEGRVVCWCIPVEVKTGEDVQVTFNQGNTFDLLAGYDEAMKEPSGAGDDNKPK